MTKIEKYQCQKCGVKTFATVKKNVINMGLVNKLCTKCFHIVIKGMI